MNAPQSEENQLTEQYDPKPDGFMRLAEAVGALATGYTLRRDGDGLWMTKFAGKVRSDTLDLLMRGGWLEEFANGGGWRLSDSGRKSYLRSTDELGDGKLVPPVLLPPEPRCPKCNAILSPTLIGGLICRSCA